MTTLDAALDNNAAENAIRPLKLGAKNWLFVGHPDAGAPGTPLHHGGERGSPASTSRPTSSTS